MKLRLVAAAFLFCGSLRADIPEYGALRKVIEGRLEGRAYLQGKAVLVGGDAAPDMATAIPFRPEMTARQVLAQTFLRWPDASALLLRSNQPGVFIRSDHLETLATELRSSDVIWIYRGIPLF